MKNKSIFALFIKEAPKFLIPKIHSLSNPIRYKPELKQAIKPKLITRSYISEKLVIEQSQLNKPLFIQEKLILDEKTINHIVVCLIETQKKEEARKKEEAKKKPFSKRYFDAGKEELEKLPEYSGKWSMWSGLILISDIVGGAVSFVSKEIGAKLRESALEYGYANDKTGVIKGVAVQIGLDSRTSVANQVKMLEAKNEKLEKAYEQTKKELNVAVDALKGEKEKRDCETLYESIAKHFSNILPTSTIQSPDCHRQEPSKSKKYY